MITEAKEIVNETAIFEIVSRAKRLNQNIVECLREHDIIVDEISV